MEATDKEQGKRKFLTTLTSRFGRAKLLCLLAPASMHASCAFRQRCAHSNLDQPWDDSCLWLGRGICKELL